MERQELLGAGPDIDPKRSGVRHRTMISFGTVPVHRVDWPEKRECQEPEEAWRTRRHLSDVPSVRTSAPPQIAPVAFFGCSAARAAGSFTHGRARRLPGFTMTRIPPPAFTGNTSSCPVAALNHT